MKKVSIYLFVLTVALGASSCMDKLTEELSMNIPVYVDYATLRSSVKSSQTRELVHPGKICFKDNYLLIVECREGIHVIDVSQPENPQNKVFIEIPGCIDIAIKDNVLYADSYLDLVAIDLSDINQPKEKNRLKDVFPYTVPAAENVDLPYGTIEQEKGVVVAWQVERVKHELEPRYYYPQYPVRNDYAKLSNDAYYFGTTNYSGGSSSGAASFGKSGSMARFGLYDIYLYIASEYVLYMFDVENAGSPVKIGTQNVGNIETMFVYNRHLFFGTPSGMQVYSLRIPTMPELVGYFWHVTSCDPVVVQNDYAYITLRGGTACQNSAVNRLDIVKCSNSYKQYDLINSYPMTEPYGLGIDRNLLFVCDGKAGLKVYDATNKENILLQASFPNIQTYDVIPADNYLFMIGNDGFYLYDYSDIHNIRQIGHIPVTKQ